MMYPDPNANSNIHVADTLPPPPADDTGQQFRLDLDPDDCDVQILEDDGEID
jgi:hypothetical protein